MEVRTRRSLRLGSVYEGQNLDLCQRRCEPDARCDWHERDVGVDQARVPTEVRTRRSLRRALIKNYASGRIVPTEVRTRRSLRRPN